jgi:hypothetical protein
VTASSSATNDPFVFTSTPGFSVRQLDSEGLVFQLTAGPIDDCVDPGVSVSVNVTMTMSGGFKKDIFLAGNKVGPWVVRLVMCRMPCSAVLDLARLSRDVLHAGLGSVCVEHVACGYL